MSGTENSTETSPALDDGWWAALLAEDERTREKKSSHAPILPKEPDEPAKRPPASGHPAALDWNRVAALYRSDEIIKLKVSGFNRGGLLVQGDEIHGFVPISHLIGLTGADPAERERLLEAYVGQELQLKVIECAPDEGRVVYSERAAQTGAGQRSHILNSLQNGQRVRGKVTNVTDFGVFVDLGGVEGLIHISELSWGRVTHPDHILQLGQEVEALVLEVAAERCRVALSLKRLLPNPWSQVAAQLTADAIVPAVITTVLSYGAFARLDDGIEGLIHASEIPLNEGVSLKQYLQEGQRVEVRVLHIDAPHHRMGLSLRLQEK
ncbi:MAG: 30S ribosomal protein S1 [Anaerolineales bacterium]|nr:30S ribosomal protein S1 [Anaerolineales bacterium]